MTDVLENLTSSINKAISQIIDYLPRAVGAIIIVLIGYLIGLLARDAVKIIVNKLFEKPLSRTRFGQSLREAGVDLGSLIGTLIMALIIAVSIVAAVDVLALTGYTGEIVSTIAVAILNITAGITILAIGIPVSIIFAEYIANFFGGTFRGKHELAVSLIYDVTALVLSVFVIALAVKVMFQYGLLLDYIVSAAPGFVTAAIILFIGYVLGDAIGKIVDRIIDAIIEKPLEVTDIGKSIKEMNIDLSGLIGGLTKAFIIVVSIVAAVEVMKLGGLTGELVYQIAIYLPKLIGGITLLTLGLILSVALARYVGKFLRAMFKDRYAGLANLAENLILLGLITVILTISLNIMLLQGSLIYPLILGILVIVAGIYVAGTVGSILADAHPTYKRLAPFVESLIILIFIVIGASGIFSQFVGATNVINTVAWGVSIAFALVLIPVIFHYTRLAWKEASRSAHEKEEKAEQEA